MTARPPRRWLRRDCHGTTAVEFAVIAGVLLPMLFGTLSLGFLMWTHNALLSTAALTARCIALGSSLCAANPKQFAVNTAQQWIVPGIINTKNVIIQHPATSCNGTAGSFVTVAITSTYWAADILPQPFAATTLQVTACFPVAAG
jgi:hypothetical protein